MASPLAKQVAFCNRRARDRGLAHTLTTLDWQRTLDFFEQKSVYCRMDEDVARLKAYCELRAIESPLENAAYAYLRCMIFGVEWDPSHHFQIAVSLKWQWEHSKVASLTAACENAWQVFHGENISSGIEIEIKHLT